MTFTWWSSYFRWATESSLASPGRPADPSTSPHQLMAQMRPYFTFSRQISSRDLTSVLSFVSETALFSAESPCCSLRASGLPVCTWKHGSPRTEPYCPLWMTADGKANLLWNITVLIEMFLFFFINVLGQQLDSLRSAGYNPVKDFWTDEWTKYRTSSLWPSRASLNRGIWQVFSP